MAESAVSSVSVLPGELCGYSGQKLMRCMVGHAPERRRIRRPHRARLDQQRQNYLVAVHVEAPTGTPDFDAAATLLTEDFEIVIP